MNAARFDSAWLEAHRGRVLSEIGGSEAGGVAVASAVTEEEVQAAVVAWAREREAERPALRLLFHPANGEYRPRRTAGRLSAMGVVAGVPDLLLPVPSGPFAGLAIELKVLPNDLTPAQALWLDLLARYGRCAVTVCWTAEQATAAITEYLDDPFSFIGGL